MKRCLRAVVLVLFIGVLTHGSSAQQDPSAPAPEGPQTTFRSGVNFVAVDVIVTDRSGNPVTGLTKDDFELFEDGRPQVVEQFRLVETAGDVDPDAVPARELRTRDDEMFDAAREDVRVYAILLDDYHVPRSRSQAVRDMLTNFIRTQVRPLDLLTVMYPLTSVTTLTFTRDHESVVQTIRQFEGRKGDHTPRNAVEEQHWRNLPAIERIRNEVVADALSALSIRLGSLREGRKSLIFVSDGLPAGTLRLRDVGRDANRHNVSLYPVDPCGLAGPLNLGGRGECTSSRNRRETLQYLAEETDGRAIVNRNTLAEGLAQIVRDSSAYYLLGYTSDERPTDGKFHQIRVRVKGRGLEVRARKGYWALTDADVARAATAKPIRLTPIQQALASIDVAADAKKYIRTWIGSERGDAGRTRVTIVWELLSRPSSLQEDRPARLSLTATGLDGTVRFSGGGGISSAPQRVTFEAPEGRLELRFAIESAADAEIIDRDVVTLDVPDLTAPEASLSTPRVYAARTANEFRVAAADAAAIPIARREFSRTERLLIRFDAYGRDGDAPTLTAALLNWNGDRMIEVPVEPAQAGATHQVTFALGALAPGEYAIQITAGGAEGEATELVPLRVGG